MILRDPNEDVNSLEELDEDFDFDDEMDLEDIEVERV